MKYHNITKDDMLNGKGLRVVLWVSGCDHHCPNCQNPITWDCNSGIVFDNSAKQEIFDQLDKDYISGITFSGGDPLHVQNREDIFVLIKEIKEKYPDKNIWLYTGYTIEELVQMIDDQNIFYILTHVDTLVEGRFIEKLKDIKYEWAGSTNQRILNKKEIRDFINKK